MQPSDIKTNEYIITPKRKSIRVDDTEDKLLEFSQKEICGKNEIVCKMGNINYLLENNKYINIDVVNQFKKEIPENSSLIINTSANVDENGIIINT